jgi:hypothetical protein
MERLRNIVKFTDNALDGVKSLEKKVVDGTAIYDLEKEIWIVYKNCESAIFLVKLEISDVEAVDNTKIQIDIDRPEYMMILAEDHLNIASKLINEGKMSDALEQLRSARNIMVEIYSNVKRERLRSLRKSHKRGDASDQKP